MDIVSALSRIMLAVPRIPGVGIVIEYASRLASGVDRPVSSAFDGSRFAANPKTSFGRRLLFAGRYHDRAERAFVKSILRTGDYAVDVGANMGVYTLLFARLVGKTGKVTAIEAEPNNAAVLRVNLDMNGYDQVKLINRGAADMDTTLTLNLHSSNLGMHSFAAAYDAGNIQIECHPLDNLVDYQPIRLMKIDIEGFEHRVLKKYFESGAPKPDYIMLEHLAELNEGDTPELCRQAGYEMHERHGANHILRRMGNCNAIAHRTVQSR